MLTRYEEVVKSERDLHERFPAKASLAYQEGFLDRPIVNEYVELLWWALKKLWPSLRRRDRQFQMVLSHDVDWPLGMLNRTPTQVLKNTVGDMVVRRSPALAMRRFQSYIQIRRGNIDQDINNTFDFIMDLSEKHNLRSSFYFIAERSAGVIDGNYSLEHPWIKALMRRMHDRGHILGLHPSYHTFRSRKRIKQEFDKLLQSAEGVGIQQQTWGGRQHYLRWEAPTTWQVWEDSGLSYDSSLGFADHAGFRCGTCYPYRVFNLQNRQALRLLERPLIIMECSLLSSAYMGLSHEKAWEEMRKLRDRCRLFSGEFTLLWHNSHLIVPQDGELYRRFVEESCSMTAQKRFKSGGSLQ